MNRRTFFTGGIGGLCLALNGRVQGAGTGKPSLSMKLEVGEKQAIELTTEPVTWRKHPVHLARFHSIQFSLDPEKHALKADLQGAVVTFDQVDYELSGAVFGADGKLLGAARAFCKVPRRWLGKAPLEKRWKMFTGSPCPAGN